MNDLNNITDKQLKPELIDIKIFVSESINNIKYIIGSIIIFLMIGIYFDKNQDQLFESSIVLKETRPSNEYDYLNLLNGNELISNKKIAEKAFYLLRDNNIFKDALKDSNIIENELDNINEELIEIEATNFELLPPIRSQADKDLYQREYSDDYNLIYKTNVPINLEVLKKMFNYILLKTNNKVKRQIDEEIKSIILNKKLNNKHLIEDHLMETDNLIFTFKNISNQRLVFLRDNLEIAKAISLDSATELLSIYYENISVNLDDFNVPHYLYGETLIKKEIKQLEDKLENLEPNLHIKEVSEILTKIKKIEEDPFFSRFKQAYDDTNINSNKNFKTFDYNLSKIQTKEIKISSVFIYIISTLLSLILSFIIIFILQIKKNYL